MSRLNGFDRIAPLYDQLKRLVFRSAIRRSEEYFIHRLPTNGNVLFLGGGTGELLVTLLRDRPALVVTFVEASSEMIARARARLPEKHREQVFFVHGTQDNVPDEQFDGIITNFYLDLFTDLELKSVCGKLKSHLKIGGVWLVSDFSLSGKWWQHLLLWVMYRFFRVTTGISARSLPLWEMRLAEHGFTPLEKVAFFGKFISSFYYRRER